jgi:hypothetical protein
MFIPDPNFSIPDPEKLLNHPKQKPRSGGGPQTDEHLPLSPLTDQFYLMTTVHFALVSTYIVKLVIVLRSTLA